MTPTEDASRIPETVVEPALLKQTLRNRSLHSLQQLDNTTIVMHPEELGLFLDALLRPSVRNYAEWGSGGSTGLVAWLLLTGQIATGGRAVSIESSPQFMSNLHSQSLIASAERLQLLNYSYGDLGPVGLIGRPLGCNMHDRFKSCAEVDPAPYVSLDRYGISRFDVILVDGRYRFACVLEALRFAHLDTHVFLHDKQNYHDSYKRWFEPIHERKTMRVLRPRKLFAELSDKEKIEYQRAVAAKRTMWS